LPFFGDAYPWCHVEVVTSRVIDRRFKGDPPFGGTEITRDPGAEDHPSQVRFASRSPG